MAWRFRLRFDATASVDCARLSIFPVLKLAQGERTVRLAGRGLPGQNSHAAAKASSKPRPSHTNNSSQLRDKIVAVVAAGVDARGAFSWKFSMGHRRRFDALSSLVASYAGRQEHLTRRPPPRQDRGLRRLQPPARPHRGRLPLGAYRLHGQLHRRRAAHFDGHVRQLRLQRDVRELPVARVFPRARA